jgi:hypothetical protein
VDDRLYIYLTQVSSGTAYELPLTDTTIRSDRSPQASSWSGIEEASLSKIIEFCRTIEKRHYSIQRITDDLRDLDLPRDEARDLRQRCDSQKAEIKTLLRIASAANEKLGINRLSEINERSAPFISGQNLTTFPYGMRRTAVDSLTEQDKWDAFRQSCGEYVEACRRTDDLRFTCIDLNRRLRASDRQSRSQLSTSATRKLRKELGETEEQLEDCRSHKWYIYTLAQYNASLVEAYQDTDYQTIPVLDRDYALIFARAVSRPTSTQLQRLSELACEIVEAGERYKKAARRLNISESLEDEGHDELLRKDADHARKRLDDLLEIETGIHQQLGEPLEDQEFYERASDDGSSERTRADLDHTILGIEQKHPDQPEGRQEPLLLMSSESTRLTRANLEALDDWCKRNPPVREAGGCKSQVDWRLLSGRPRTEKSQTRTVSSGSGRDPDSVIPFAANHLGVSNNGQYENDSQGPGVAGNKTRQKGKGRASIPDDDSDLPEPPTALVPYVNPSSQYGDDTVTEMMNTQYMLAAKAYRRARFGFDDQEEEEAGSEEEVADSESDEEITQRISKLTLVTPERASPVTVPKGDKSRHRSEPKIRAHGFSRQYEAGSSKQSRS